MRLLPGDANVMTFVNGEALSVDNFGRLEKKRCELGVSIEVLAAAAEISWRTYERARAGERVTARTLKKLGRALRALERRRPAPKLDRPGAARVAYRGSLAVLAAMAGLDAAAIAAVDPRVPKPASAVWNAAIALQQRAVYLAVTEFGLPITLAAGAAGITKQGVSLWVRRVEDARDDPALDALLTRAAEFMAGELPWAA